MNCDRKDIIRAVMNRPETEETELPPFTTDHYAEDVFHFTRMKERLPKPIYKKLMDTVSEGKELDASIADAVAHAMKIAPAMSGDQIIVITLSGRGDKDCAAIARYRGEDIHE